MADAPLGHPLSYVRHQRGWGKTEFARIMQQHGAELGVPLATNRTTVWKWENGQRPDRDAQRVLADLLRVPTGKAQPDIWPSWLPAWEVRSLGFSWTLTGTVAALEDLVRSAHMDRRGFLTVTGGSLTTLAASWATAPSAFAAAVAEPGSMTA